MAEENQWILNALDGVLPEQTIQFLAEHVLARGGAVQTVLRALHTLTRNVVAALYPVLQPVLARVGAMLSDSPDFVFVLSLVAILFAALQTLLWVHRVMMFWTRLMGRLILWSLVAAVLAMAWQRGPEAVIRDAVVFASKAAGYAALVKDIWLAEYNKYDAQTKNNGKRIHAGNRRGGK